MIVPVRALRKKDLEWLGTNRCKAHSMTYLCHYNCFLKEQPDTSPLHEKVGILDIETNNLYATFGYVFSYCIKELDGPILKRVVTKEEIESYAFDKNLMKQLCKDIRKFHRLIVYWGTDAKFNIPFIRSRALKANLDFPLYREIYATDLHPIVRNKLRLHNNRLATACSFFGILAKSHPLKEKIWQKALAGDAKSLNYILKHNIEDVISTEKLYKKLIPYARKNNTSI